MDNYAIASYCLCELSTFLVVITLIYLAINVEVMAMFEFTKCIINNNLI